MMMMMVMTLIRGDALLLLPHDCHQCQHLSIITTSSLSSPANRPRSEDKRNRWVIIVDAGCEHRQNMSIKLHSCQNIDADQNLMEQIQQCI